MTTHNGKVKIEHENGDYPFVLSAAASPGDIVVRPSGTQAVLHGLRAFVSGERVNATPLIPTKTAIVTAASATTWSAGDQLWWDATGAGEAVTTSNSGANKHLGRAIDAKVAGETLKHVELTNE